jgi:hypothetical protein
MECESELTRVVFIVTGAGGPLRGEAIMKNINSVDDLLTFAEEHKLRRDWHEPDEQDVNAQVIGDYLDNAMGSTMDHNCGELNVVLTKNGKGVAVVNLATLLAWATHGVDLEMQIRKAESDVKEMEYQKKRYTGLLKNKQEQLARLVEQR